MPYCDVYIGSLEDKSFQWTNISDERWGIGNAPFRIGPTFPPPAPFNTLVDKIDKEYFSGKQIDWGAYVAIVTKRQIQDFIEECYRNDKTYSDPYYMPHLYGRLHELKQFVASLDPTKRFFLVASEL
jgi:hypothetical protein